MHERALKSGNISTICEPRTFEMCVLDSTVGETSCLWSDGGSEMLLNTEQGSTFSAFCLYRLNECFWGFGQKDRFEEILLIWKCSEKIKPALMKPPERPQQAPQTSLWEPAWSETTS